MVNENKHQIWWDAELEIARAKAYGVIDESGASWILQATIDMAEQHGDQLDWLIDLSEMTKATAKGRKLLVEASAHPSIRKYAFVGASTFLRTVANFIASAAGQANARHFATEAEALDWINEGK
jgi:hypothetical protein